MINMIALILIIVFVFSFGFWITADKKSELTKVKEALFETDDFELKILKQIVDQELKRRENEQSIWNQKKQ